ncbi:hypothetical protein [Dactylosporangium sp. CA-233914]|uniref:hypothetical protein n=1 Tax=Dactylosporangium sp. CA-233914 TaxID=3239934 RepID=UPI003D92EEC2
MDPMRDGHHPLDLTQADPATADVDAPSGPVIDLGRLAVFPPPAGEPRTDAAAGQHSPTAGPIATGVASLLVAATSAAGTGGFPAGTQARGRVGPRLSRLAPGTRAAVLLALGLAAAFPPAAPKPLSEGRPVPLPSYCTGTPIPGGRLNIVRNDTYVILDATTNTVISYGPCPRGTGTRANTGTRTSTAN